MTLPTDGQSQSLSFPGVFFFGGGRGGGSFLCNLRIAEVSLKVFFWVGFGFLSYTERELPQVRELRLPNTGQCTEFGGLYAFTSILNTHSQTLPYRDDFICWKEH